MTDTPYDFEATRRTGPLDRGERLALAKLFADFPRPLITLRVIVDTPKHLSSDVYIGFARLEQRGWVRVRGRRGWSGRTRWDLTSRVEIELPMSADPVARLALVDVVNAELAKEDAEIAAGIAAATAAAPPDDVQRSRMGFCLAFIGWVAHHGDEVVRGHRQSTAALFDQLLQLVELHGSGYPGAEEVRAASLANSEISLDLVDLARDACEEVPLDAFKALLRRLGNESWLTHPEDTLQ